MKIPSARLSSTRATGFVLLLLAGAGTAFTAEPPVPAATNAPGAAAETPNSPDVQRSLQQVREQLLATQLALANSQAAAEAKARTETAAISEQLEIIKSSLAEERERRDRETRFWQSERDRQDLETRQAAAEQQRLQATNDRANERLLYIASSVGGLGIMAMLFMPLFQWRAAQRTAQANAQLSALMAPNPPLVGDGAEPSVARSNQRLLSAIDRIEQRILELENTASPSSTAIEPSPNAVARVSAGAAATTPRLPAAASPNARISLLLAKGRSLLSTNKPAEALACFDEILADDPRHTEALLKKGLALERLERDAEAIASYDRVIAVDARISLAYLHKGGVCQRLGRHEDAIASYEQALRAEDVAK